MKKSVLEHLCLSLLILFVFPTQAALIDRGNGLIYDSTLNITWMQDANYAKTSGFDEDGRMDFSTALAFADSVVYQGFEDWRLAKVDVDDVTCSDSSTYFSRTQYYGLNCAGSQNELGYMYYNNLGFQPHTSVEWPHTQYNQEINASFLDGEDKSEKRFNNLIAHVYGTTLPVWPELVSNVNWGFNTYAGRQADYNNNQQLYVWLVRDGDSIVNVEEPYSALLIMMLAITLVFNRKNTETTSFAEGK